MTLSLQLTPQNSRSANSLDFIARCVGGYDTIMNPLPVSLPGSSPPGSRSKASRQITRNRASYSCRCCRRRKVRCDKIHPICGNCSKNNNECIYDAVTQKDDNARDTSQPAHGVKRRRENAQTLEEGVDELQSIYGHLKQNGSSTNEKSDPRAIESRLDKLMSMIERLGGTNQALEAVAENHNIPITKVESTTSNDEGPNHSHGNAISRPTSPRRIAAESSGDEFPIPSGRATDLVDPVGSLNLGHLSLEDGGRSRLVKFGFDGPQFTDPSQICRHDILGLYLGRGML